MWRGHERCSTPRSWRGFADDFGDLEELLLLAAILLENLVQIDIFSVTTFYLGSFGLCFLLAFTGLLGSFLSLRKTLVEGLDGGVIIFFLVLRVNLFGFFGLAAFLLVLAHDVKRLNRNMKRFRCAGRKEVKKPASC